jgi:hypothetical protein
MIDFSLVKNMALPTVQKFRMVSLAFEGLSMDQIAFGEPFQFFLLGISHSVVHFSVFNILQWWVWQWQWLTVVKKIRLIILMLALQLYVTQLTLTTKERRGQQWLSLLAMKPLKSAGVFVS